MALQKTESETDALRQAAIVAELESMKGEIQWVIDRPRLQTVQDLTQLQHRIDQIFNLIAEIV